MVRHNTQLELVARSALKYWRQFLASGTEIGQAVNTYEPKPSALAIKEADLLGTIRGQELYFDLGDMIIGAEVDGRTISTIRKAQPFGGCDSLRYVKLIERRPGSGDQLGLDHLDLTVFPHTDLKSLCERLQEFDVNCRVQRNQSHSWLSIEHDGFEFKMMDHTVWRVCCDQLVAVLNCDEFL